MSNGLCHETLKFAINIENIIKWGFSQHSAAGTMPNQVPF